MDNIGDFMLPDELHVAFAICDIELLKSAGEVKLLSTNIACNYIFGTKLSADGMGEWDADLTLAAS